MLSTLLLCLALAGDYPPEGGAFPAPDKQQPPTPAISPVVGDVPPAEASPRARITDVHQEPAPAPAAPQPVTAPPAPAPAPQKFKFEITATAEPVKEAITVTTVNPPAAAPSVPQAAPAQPQEVTGELKQPRILGVVLGRIGDCLSKHGDPWIRVPRPRQTATVRLSPQAALTERTTERIVYVPVQDPAPRIEPVYATPQAPAKGWGWRRR